MSSIKNLKRRTKDLLFESILKLKGFSPEKSLLILSEARGGSTWLMEMLSNLPGSCINWEPLHVNAGVVPKKYRFGWRPYIPAEDKNRDFINLFNEIHAFKRSSPYTRKYLTWTSLIGSTFVITKYVRANLLLPYFQENFKFKFPPVFLIRHPIDTCMSQMKAFKNKDHNMNKDGIPNWINNERFILNKAFMSQLETDLEVKVLNWCLNNLSTLNYLKSHKNVIVVFYSDLLVDPEKEVRRILDLLNLGMHREIVLNSMDFRKASSTDFSKQFKNDPVEQLNKNIDSLDARTKASIQKIFDHFEFELYNAYSPLPDKKYFD